MSSYYPSFSLAAPNGIRYNSYKDKNLIVVHFESGDSGEVDTFLGMEPVYTDNAYGTRRIDYGAKYNNVAVIRISVMKANGMDFTVAEVRDFLRWTTGSRTTSYLDLVDGEKVCASFLGRVTAVYQQKLDARTVGFVIEHTSVSPYAYSPIQYASISLEQKLDIDRDGVIDIVDGNITIDDGTLVNSVGPMFSISSDGVVYIDNSVFVTIKNDTDDLSDYVYLDTIFTNTSSSHLIIKNQTLYEESGGADGLTEIIGATNKDVITLSSGQFITSDTGKSLGNKFNFIWPKLLPGDNEFIISSSGEGVVQFMYRTPIKIGDCAIDVSVCNNGLCGCDCPDDFDPVNGPVTWNDILGKPNTVYGYNITDVYTKAEINNKLNKIDVDIDADELDDMLDDVLK